MTTTRDDLERMFATAGGAGPYQFDEAPTAPDNTCVRWGRGCTSPGQPYILLGERQVTAPDSTWSVERQQAWLEGFAAGVKAGH